MASALAAAASGNPQVRRSGIEIDNEFLGRRSNGDLSRPLGSLLDVGQGNSTALGNARGQGEARRVGVGERTAAVPLAVDLVLAVFPVKVTVQALRSGQKCW